MIKLTTQDTFQEHEIVETLDLVMGSVSKTRHIFAHILAVLRQFIGGKVGSYTKLMEYARKDAVDRLIKAAKEHDADGIVAVRVVTSNVTLGGLEVLAYGTAVRFKKRNGAADPVMK